MDSDVIEMYNLLTRDGFAIKFAAAGETVDAHNGEIALALVPGARAYAYGEGSIAYASGGSLAVAYGEGSRAHACEGASAYKYQNGKWVEIQ